MLTATEILRPDLAARRRAASVIRPVPNESSLLADLAQASGQFIENLGLLLDTPGAIARGVLAGDPLSGFSTDWDRRVSGSELNDLYGLSIRSGATAPFDTRTIAGFATEVVTDPLFWLTGPARAATAAGRAAAKAGLNKYAQRAFVANRGLAAAQGTARGKYISSLFDRNLVPQTKGFFDAVSPVGERVARANVSLDEVIRAAPDPASARQNVINALGGDAAALTPELLGQRLGGLFGVSGFGGSAAFKPFGSDRILGALDYLGARARFSPAGALAAASFSKAAKGRVNVGDQIFALRSSQQEELARAAGRLRATKHNQLLDRIVLPNTVKSLLGADSLLSPQGNDLLQRLAENKGNATDLQILAQTPGLQNWLDSWSVIRQQMFHNQKQLGLRTSFYKSKYKTQYSPRFGDEFDFEDMGRGKGLDLYGARESVDYGRRRYLDTPGGTDDLRQLSKLPLMQEYAKKASQIKDEDAADEIVSWFASRHPLTPIAKPQAIKIARTLKRRAETLPSDVPIFAAHPANAQARRIISSEIAQSRVEFLLEALAESAELGAASKGAGRYRNLGEEWALIAPRMGFVPGAKSPKSAANIALQARLGIAQGITGPIDLTQWRVPERVVRRLQQVNEIYSQPQAQTALGAVLDSFTQATKGFLLATPRRFVRDFYSNAVSGFLETGNAQGIARAFGAASQLLAGKRDEAASLLRTIPRYAGISSPADVVNAFQLDVGANGVLAGLRSSELLSAVRSGEMSQLLPGSTPISVSRGLKELGSGWSGFAEPFQDIFAAATTGKPVRRYAQGNPVLRSSEKVGDAVDSIGRLGTFIELLRQGVAPQEAADRVRRALVDYDSLTSMERGFLRRIFPWYAYNSRIGAYVVNSLMEAPGGLYGQMIRASNTLQRGSGEDYIPDNLRRRFSIPLSDAQARFLGVYTPDVRTFVSDIDLPGIDVLNYLDVNSSQRTLGNILSQTQLPLQSLANLAFGRDLFTGRSLKESVTPADRLYMAATGSPQGLSPLAKTAVGMIPGTQPLINTLGTLADERLPQFERRLGKAALNLLSGIKLTDVDERYYLQDLQRKIADQLDQYTYTFSKSYIPEELMPLLSPREQELFALSKQKDKEARALYKKQRTERERAQQAARSL